MPMPLSSVSSSNQHTHSKKTWQCTYALVFSPGVGAAQEVLVLNVDMPLCPPNGMHIRFLHIKQEGLAAEMIERTLLSSEAND